MLFHVDLGFMPLFHGQSPEINSQVPLGALPRLLGAMLGYFFLPLLAIVLISFADSAIGLGDSLAAVEAAALLAKCSLPNH